jgi:hypothetical protein
MEISSRIWGLGFRIYCLGFRVETVSAGGQGLKSKHETKKRVLDEMLPYVAPLRWQKDRIIHLFVFHVLVCVCVCLVGGGRGGEREREREREAVSCTLHVCIYVCVGELNRVCVHV